GVVPGVAAAQNDITYDSSRVRVAGKLTCADDPATSCLTTQDCVVAGDAGPCIVVPDCAVNPAIMKEATVFAYLPTGCAGTTLPVSTACNTVRALVFSLTVAHFNNVIPDG